MPAAPKSPLKSAMKVPGTPGRSLQNPLSPTFREEQILEEREKATDKEQARDLVSGQSLPSSPPCDREGDRRDTASRANTSL